MVGRSTAGGGVAVLLPHARVVSVPPKPSASRSRNQVRQKPSWHSPFCVQGLPVRVRHCCCVPTVTAICVAEQLPVPETLTLALVPGPPFRVSVPERTPGTEGRKVTVSVQEAPAARVPPTHGPVAEKSAGADTLSVPLAKPPELVTVHCRVPAAAPSCAAPKSSSAALPTRLAGGRLTQAPAWHCW